jgi:hypothetical protein
MKLVCKLEGEGSTDGRGKSGGILRDAVRAAGGSGIGGGAVRVAFSNVNGIREFVPEGVKSCQLMGEDTLKGDVHALEGIAQGVVESSKVMLAKENLGYVGLGGSVVLKRNITGEVFQYELRVNPWGNENWTVYVMVDCRIGGMIDSALPRWWRKPVSVMDVLFCRLKKSIVVIGLSIGSRRGRLIRIFSSVS